jgi:hypothetical protein
MEDKFVFELKTRACFGGSFDCGLQIVDCGFWDKDTARGGEKRLLTKDTPCGIVGTEN